MMKKLLLTTFLLAIMMLTLDSCRVNMSSGQNQYHQMKVNDRGYDFVNDRYTLQASKTTELNENTPSNLTLADLLRKTSGVYVTGNGYSARVRVSGISSFQGSSPLFVINGNAVGSDFSHAASLVNPNNVASITVLKGSDAAIYGARGAFGVVLIRTQ